jgi:N-acetylglucosaminyldiphosphoundecaprenol N-acetyl-beta-D-mannosaminyltransferase
MYLQDVNSRTEASIQGPVALTSGPALIDPPDPSRSPAPPPPRQTFPVVNLRGVDLHAVTEKQVVTHILDEIDFGRGGTVVTPNLDHLRRCLDDLSFGALVAEADLVVADGMPLVWAARVQGTPLPQRVAGSDLIWSLSAGAAKRGKSVFMLGGDFGTADAAAKTLVEKYPELKVAGAYWPPPGFDKSDAEIVKIVEALTATQPDIVYVALGSPKQELLIERIRGEMPRAWWLGVGISFSFVCGNVKRAPRFMQKIGLEWVHRFGQEPKRLFKRYFVSGLPFAASLMLHASWHRLTSKIRRTTNSSRYAKMLRRGGSGKSNGNGNGHRNGNGNGHANGNGNGHASVTIEAPRVSTLDPLTGEAQPALYVPDPTIAPRNEHSPTTRALSRLRALVLLGGSVRATELSTSVGRSILDLPVDEGGSILNHWMMHAAELAHYAALESLPVRVMVNRNSPEPISVSARYQGMYKVERDQSEFRGTGGVLKDLTGEYGDDDLVLVANAAQILIDPLSVIAAALDHKRGDISLISHVDGTPSGVMLLRCKTLQEIAPSGFVDMKEQALPLIAQKFDVRVMQCRRPSGLPIRSLRDYIAALKHYHRRRAGKPSSTDPLGEDFSPAFAIVEDGAIVAPRAHVHDSIVLKGGVVESDAAVVRCVVCPGGVVKQKTTAVDRFLCAMPRIR